MSLDHHLSQLHDWRIIGVVAATSRGEKVTNEVSTRYML
jgi:hypothetical protein